MPCTANKMQKYEGGTQRNSEDVCKYRGTKTEGVDTFFILCPLFIAVNNKTPIEFLKDTWKGMHETSGIY